MQGPLDARVDQLASASRPPPADRDVRAQLERIIGSPEFPNAGHAHAFLRYVVGEAVAGRTERIKGYSIAVEVFNRDEGFKQDDPVVRIEAGRLRHTIERYYLVAGQNDPVRIDIPKGKYVPFFTWNDPIGAEEPARSSPHDRSHSQSGPSDSARSSHLSNRRLRSSTAVAGVAVAALTVHDAERRAARNILEVTGLTHLHRVVFFRSEAMSSWLKIGECTKPMEGIVR